MMQQFVAIALRASTLLGIMDKKGQGMVMRFSKLYEPDKMWRIVEKAKSHYWHDKYPVASFMKAVGEINKEDAINFPDRIPEKKPYVPKPKKNKQVKLKL